MGSYEEWGERGMGYEAKTVSRVGNCTPPLA